MFLTQALGLSITQSQVDFVIPDIDQDRRLCIDPFLLYKSKDPALRTLHQRLIDVFSTAFQYFRAGNQAEMNRLIDFPEVNNIALGYSEQRIKGSGMGAYLNRLVADTLANSPELPDRGLRHIEELQLVSLGIGADRVSDMVANLLKMELAKYTREQCEVWQIPVEKGVPLEHVFDLDSFEWYDEYTDLPINPKTGMPLLFVPRRMVRILPWINFEDYEAHEFRLFLRPTKSRSWDRLPGNRKPIPKQSKAKVVEVTRQQIRLLDEYVKRKESQAAQAEPQITAGAGQELEAKSEELIGKLRAIEPGPKGAGAYQRLMLGILNHLFEPELTDGRLEEETIEGTERRDIIFLNESDRSFWQFVRQEHASLLVMFEAKNVQALENQHINQVAAYLGERLGRFGVILTRNPPSEAQIRKVISVFNDSYPKKVILVLHDRDIEEMIRIKDRGDNPTKYIQNIYRNFKVQIQ